jgi:hypothetical protein
VVAFPAAGVEHRASRIRATGGRSLLDGATVLAAVEHRHERRLGTVGGAVHPQGNCRAGTARPGAERGHALRYRSKSLKKMEKIAPARKVRAPTRHIAE